MFPFWNIFFHLRDINFMFLHCANEGGDDVIVGSMKTVQNGSCHAIAMTAVMLLALF